MAVSKKPGVMLYFELLPMFEQMELDHVGEITLAVLKYAQSSEDPTLNSDTTRLVWSLIKSRIDADSDRYRLACLKKKYAGYISRAKERGKSEILTFEEFAESVGDD